MMDVTIVIVCFNARDDLERCLGSLADAPPVIAHEIVLVDNGSTDGGPAAAAARWPALRVVTMPENAGFAAGCNVGIRAARGDLILLLNSDTIPPEGAVDRLAESLRGRPDVGVVGPRLVDAAGRPELSFGRMIGPLRELARKRLLSAYARNAGWAVRRVERLTAEEGHPDWVSGACLMVRRADAVAAGLLDERFFMYTEDVDFCAAIRALGRRVLFTPDVEVVHLRGRSRSTRPAATETAYRRSQLAFYRKHRPLWVPVLRVYLRLRGRHPDGT